MPCETLDGGYAVAAHRLTSIFPVGSEVKGREVLNYEIGFSFVAVDVGDVHAYVNYIGRIFE